MAANQLGMEPMQGEPMKNNQADDLQKLQKQVADKAKDLNQPMARAAAENATEALNKGDLQKAIEDQQKAIDALQPQGMSEPMNGEPKNASMM